MLKIKKFFLLVTYKKIANKIIRIFVKYNLNEYQGDLLKNQNEPNPVFLQELTDLMSNFIWNWSDYLSKYKVIED